jgi:hypothetical protein
MQVRYGLALLLIGNGADQSLLSEESAVHASGLLAEYFDDANLGARRVLRTDARIDFSWGQGAPAAEIDSESFSLERLIRAPFDEGYTFRTRTNDGVRLWIDGVLVIDDWNQHAAADRRGSIALRAGCRSGWSTSMRAGRRRCTSSGRAPVRRRRSCRKIA